MIADPIKHGILRVLNEQGSRSAEEIRVAINERDVSLFHEVLSDVCKLGFIWQKHVKRVPGSSQQTLVWFITDRGQAKLKELDREHGNDQRAAGPRP